jgi:beta-galactosidase
MHQIDTLAIQTTQYLIRPNGSVDVAVDLDAGPTAPELPRIGMETLLDERFTQTQYYGRGPGESYWDRKLGMKIGRYDQAIADWPTAYTRPQANGNRTDLRWLRISAESDAPSLRISASEGEWLSMGVSPYHRSDLEEVDHWHELPAQAYPQLQIDHRIMGVGGDDTWSPRSKPHTEHLLPAGQYQYRFQLQVLEE